MGIISWIIFGLIAGILAKWIMPGKDGGGFIVTVILGVIGAVVGGYISTFFGMGRVDGFNLGSFVVAVIGAWWCFLSTERSKAKPSLIDRVAAAALFREFNLAARQCRAA